MKGTKRAYIRENFVNFRPSPQTMRELEEMWEEWGESRTEVILRCIHHTYLLWKNGWKIPAKDTKTGEYKPLKVIES